MLSMKYFGNNEYAINEIESRYEKKRGKNVYELASKHFGMILPTNYFQMILLCGYPPPPPKKMINR